MDEFILAVFRWINENRPPPGALTQKKEIWSDIWVHEAFGIAVQMDQIRRKGSIREKGLLKALLHELKDCEYRLWKLWFHN